MSSLLTSFVAGLLAGSLLAQAPEPLVGTVRDPDGKPVAGAVVEVWRRLGEGTVILDLEYANAEKRVARMQTGKNGGFALQLPVGVPCEVRIDHAPHGRWIREDVLPGEELHVQLAEPATFRGKVVGPDGVGAPSSLRAFQSDGIRLPLGRTDEQGQFCFERLPAGAFRVEIAPDKFASPGWQEVVFTAGEVLERSFVVPRGFLLTGRITDAATGAPIAGAVVGEGWTKFKAVRSDQDGRYRLEGAGSTGRNEVYCSADGYSSGRAPRPAPLTDSTVLDFALQRGNAVVGVVVDREGKPIAGLYVGLFGTVHDGKNQFHDWPSGRTDGEGRFRVQGLREDLPGTLIVRGEGHASLVYHLPPADARGVMQAGTIVMPPARVVRGRLVDADGKPLARVKVGLWGTNGDREVLAKLSTGNSPGGWDLLRMYVALRNVRTDDYGAFAFGDVPPGTYDLVVYGEDNTRLETVKDIVVEASGDPKPVVVTR